LNLDKKDGPVRPSATAAQIPGTTEQSASIAGCRRDHSIEGEENRLHQRIIRSGGTVVADNAAMTPGYLEAVAADSEFDTLFFGRSAVTLKKSQPGAFGHLDFVRFHEMLVGFATSSRSDSTATPPASPAQRIGLFNISGTRMATRQDKRWRIGRKAAGISKFRFDLWRP
jgi:hypothetical protein